jgi:EmrB/QacA subfamily drug resistance transporter
MDDSSQTVAIAPDRAADAAPDQTLATAPDRAVGTAADPSARVPRRWLAFAAVVAAAVMDLLDSTIAQVAAPSIRRDLGGTFTVIEWVTAAYALAMAVGLLIGGRLGDMFGRRRMLIAGVGAFVLASAAAAASVSPGELIAARAAQGFAGALMLPQVLGLMRDLFAAEEMGKAFGVYGPVMGLSAMLGPIVGGGFIGLDLWGSGWRMIFLVNVPVGVLAMLGAWRLVPAVRPTARGARMDWAGVVLAATGMFMIVFPLVQGRQLHWPVWLVAMLVASLPVLAAFAVHQVRRARSGQTPLVDPGIFTKPAYTSGLLFSLVFVASLGGIVLVFNVLLQVGLHFTPWHSALTTAPWAAGAFVGAAAGGMTMAKLGRRVLQAGLVVEVAGLLGIYVVLQIAGTGAGSLDLLAPMIVGGIGMGMVFVPLFDIVMAGVAPAEMGSASAVLQSVNGLGTSIGIAGLGAMFLGLAGAGLPREFIGAGEWTVLATVALLVLAFLVAYRLPHRARESQAAEPAGARATGGPLEPAPA